MNISSFVVACVASSADRKENDQTDVEYAVANDVLKAGCDLFLSKHSKGVDP